MNQQTSILNEAEPNAVEMSLDELDAVTGTITSHATTLP